MPGSVAAAAAGEEAAAAEAAVRRSRAVESAGRRRLARPRDYVGAAWKVRAGARPHPAMFLLTLCSPVLGIFYIHVLLGISKAAVLAREESMTACFLAFSIQ